MNKIQPRTDQAKERNKTKLFFVDFQRIERQPTSDQDWEIYHKLAAAPSPEDLLIKEEESKALRQILTSAPLSRFETTCIRMSLEGSKQADIARELNRSPKTIHEIMKRAIRKIRLYLANRDFQKT